MDPREIAKLINEDFDELTPTVKGKNGGPRKTFFEASTQPMPLGDPDTDGTDVPSNELSNLDAPTEALPKDIDSGADDKGVLNRDAKMGEIAALSSNMEKGLSAAKQGEEEVMAQTTNANNAATAKDAEDAAIINNFELATQKQQAAQDEVSGHKKKLKTRFGSDNVEDAKEKLIFRLATGKDDIPAATSLPEWRVNFNKALNEALD